MGTNIATLYYIHFFSCQGSKFQIRGNTCRLTYSRLTYIRKCFILKLLNVWVNTFLCSPKSLVLVTLDFLFLFTVTVFRLQPWLSLWFCYDRWLISSLCIYTGLWPLQINVAALPVEILYCPAWERIYHRKPCNNSSISSFARHPVSKGVRKVGILAISFASYIRFLCAVSSREIMDCTLCHCMNYLRYRHGKACLLVSCSRWLDVFIFFILCYQAFHP